MDIQNFERSEIFTLLAREVIKLQFHAGITHETPRSEIKDTLLLTIIVPKVSVFWGEGGRADFPGTIPTE